MLNALYIEVIFFLKNQKNLKFTFTSLFSTKQQQQQQQRHFNKVESQKEAKL